LSRAQLEHAIAILIGKAPADFSIAATTAPLDVPGAAVRAAIRAARPAARYLRQRTQDGAANAQIGVAQAQFYPTLGLSGA
jgi:outer membrane protein TolC